MCACPTAVTRVRARSAGDGEHRRERLAAARGGAGDVVGVHHVDHPLERVHELGATRTDGPVAHEPVETPDVLQELPHGDVAPSDRDADAAVDRLRPAVAGSPSGVGS